MNCDETHSAVHLTSGDFSYGLISLLRFPAYGLFEDVLVEQLGVLATLSRWRPRVQIPSRTLYAHGTSDQVVKLANTRLSESRAAKAWEFDSPLGHL